MRHRLTSIAARRGVSLMETIVVVGVMSVLMLMLSQIFILNYQIYFQQVKRTDNETGAILAAKTISQATRGATDVEITHDFGGTPHVSSADSLVLKMPSLDATGHIVAAAYDYMAFYRDATAPTKIRIVTDANAASYRKSGTRLVTAFNSALVFRYDNPDITKANRISVYVVNTQANRGATLTTKGWTAIFLRNY